MARDFYAILGVARDATPDQVKRGYRKQALHWHPDKHADRRQEAEERFKEVAEAYMILHDQEKRAIYDRFGEEGLRSMTVSESVRAPSGEPRTFFSGEPFANLDLAFHLFETMFNSTDPFASDFDLGLTDFSTFPAMDERKWRPRPERKRKDPDVLVDLELTLDELFFGCKKQKKVMRRVILADGTAETKTETVDIDVCPGWKEGTRIRFAELGDEAPNVTPADVVFVVKQLPHPRFTRAGDDLIVTLDITLKEALCGFSREVVTIDDRHVHIQATEVVTPGSVKVIHGEGMPKAGSAPGQPQKGNLLAKFNVSFPSHIPEADREVLKTVLP